MSYAGYASSRQFCSCALTGSLANCGIFYLFSISSNCLKTLFLFLKLFSFWVMPRNLWQGGHCAHADGLTVQHMYSESSILYIVNLTCEWSARLLHPDIHVRLAAHTHTGSTHATISASISWTGMWNTILWEFWWEKSPALTLSTELNLGLQLFCITGKSCRPAELFIIFPFTHKVLQKYRQVNSDFAF